jgi:hypothetical protein
MRVQDATTARQNKRGLDFEQSWGLPCHFPVKPPRPAVRAGRNLAMNVPILSAVPVLLLSWVSVPSVSAQNWSIVKDEKDPAMQILCDGMLVTKYHCENVPRPFFYPVIGPGGEHLTRGYPMEWHEGEAKDHYHHRSMWFGHKGVNGVDFWSEEQTWPAGKKPAGTKLGKIVHTGFGSMKMGTNPAQFTVRNDWVGPDGVKICEDARTFTFTKTPAGEFFVDWDITLKAGAAPVRFEDDKDGTMALRVVPGLQLVSADDKTKKSGGSILTSQGIKDQDAWGKRAPWVDYFGTDRKGQAVGVAIFDHPNNLRHPTWWHARDYGLFCANPFGISHFEKKEKPEGEFVIAPGDSLRLRYRFFLHKGSPEQAGVAAAYAAYALQK